MVKKFDIIVHDQDPQVPAKPENGVFGESAEDLANMYKMCGQTIEIVREYSDDSCNDYGKMKVEDTSSFRISGMGGKGTGLMKVPENLPKLNIPNDNKTTTSNPTISQHQPSVITEPPRFFSVGGIKCKMENGKLYQKQWIRLSDDDMAEFRIVSDKNNKICPLKDKHVEMMKWVLTEDDNQNSDEEV